jgi:hypothetical protein
VKDRDDDDDDDDNDGVVERDNEEERAGGKDIEHAKAYWRGDEGHRDDGVKDGGWQGGDILPVVRAFIIHGSWDATRQQAKCGAQWKTQQPTKREGG